MTQDGPPPRHLHPVAGEPPYDPRYDPTPPDTGRQPPQDETAEQSCLGAMLISPDAITDVTAILLPSDYYRPAHEQIHDAIVELHHRGEPVDMVTVAAELAAHKDHRGRTRLEQIGGPLYLHTLTETVPIAANATHYARIVLEKSKLRGIVEAGTKLVQLGYAGHLDQAELHIGDSLDHLAETAMRFTTATAGNSTWAPLDLDDVLAGGEIDPPPALLERHDGQMLLYAGAVHTVSGEPGSGKTWLTLLAAVQQLALGDTVTMIDFEDRASRVIGRLLALGAHPGTVRTNFRYVRPNTGLDTTTTQDLLDAVHGSTLVILDGVTEAMTMHGYDLNSNADVASFYDLLPRRIADHTGAAVVMIDHVVKDGEKQGRWALGGQHKLAGIDGVAYLVKAIEKFGRGKIGHARLFVSKDRPGYVEEIAVGMTVAELVLDARDVNFLRADLKAPSITPVDEAGNMRPTVLMERVSRWLELQPGANRSRITESVTGKVTYVRRALDRLIQEGYIEVTAGSNREQFHRVVTPFRQDPEEDQA